MKRILLVGNGFNLLSNGGTSWNELLNQLAGAPKTQHEEEVRSAKPFTLWFEEIASKQGRRDLKQVIADFLKEQMKPNRQQKELMALDFEHILTTNYDYNLENSTGQQWDSNFPARETFYSLFRRRSHGDRHVWHIHGELDTVGSIMLGHEQYSGYIHKIRNFLTSGVETTAKERGGKPYLSKFSRKQGSTKDHVENWVDLFLEHEVHIVGFGLDYTENHLWNLITEKQRLKKKGFSIAQAVFHRCSGERQSTVDEARLSILSALGVEVIDHAAKSYSAAYDHCIKSLR